MVLNNSLRLGRYVCANPGVRLAVEPDQNIGLTEFSSGMSGYSGMQLRILKIF